MTNLRHLHYFHVVAEELSFSRAADRLCTDPSAISKVIKKLEYHLGIALLDRTQKKKIALTDEGRIFF